MAKGMTTLEAIEIVLRESDRPLNAKEILREIRKRQLTEISGKTPDKTIRSRISVDIKRKGEASRFMQVDRGLYTITGRSEKRYFATPHRRKLSPSVKVLVFPTRHLSEIGHFHGIRRDFQPFVERLLDPKISFFMKRVDAEGTSDFKQIVSYVIIRYQDEILCFTRGKITNIGDYLDGQYSIGFGGHVEERSDFLPLFPAADLGYTNAVVRELEEEIIGLSVDVARAEESIVGVLNDDSTQLGRRHFAIIHLLDIEEPYVKKGEISVNDLRFVKISNLANEFAGYEYWSKLCIQTFFGNQISISSYVQPIKGFSLRSQPNIILIVGYIGSGKTEVCTLLEVEFGYTMIRCSRVMQKIIECGSIEEIGRRGLQEEGLKLVNSKGGHERLAKGIAEFMDSHPGESFVLDGLRYPQTYEELKKIVNKPITVIYIENTIDNLFKYYQDRDSSETSFSEFLEIVHHPVEREIERFLPIANIVVYNHGSLDSYIREIRRFFRSELVS
jgi:predicted NUDIX family phosphoesterase/dephospho-CoA kinase